MIEERHLTKREIVPSTRTEEKHLTKKEYVPYTPYGSKIQIPIIGPNTEKMETIIAVNFTSLDQKINYPIACKKTDIFQNVEFKLYNEFPYLKNKKIYFVANGNVVNRSLTFEQNQITSGTTILIKEN